MWQNILEYARWAPSPHNTQPWRLHILSETEATLLYDPKRLIPDTDVTSQFSTIGFAIFLEYLTIAAAQFGKTLHWSEIGTINPKVSEPTPLFTLTLNDEEPTILFDAELILKRRTSRLPYDDEKPIAPRVMHSLEELAGSFGYQLKWSQDPETVQWVLNLNRDTLFYDMDDDIARTEVRQWIRFSQQDARRRKDGLAARCMRMPGWLMRIFFLNHNIINWPIVKQGVRWYYLRSMRGTTTVAWITGPSENHKDWLVEGKILARLWLILTQHGMYLHPFGSVITNKTANAELRKKIRHAEGDHTPWFLARLGYSETPPASERLSVKEILI